MPASSIIIVNRNGGEVLAPCIESVRRNTWDYEILLVDNGSTDNSLSLVKQGPDLRLIRLRSNLGFAGANNVAIRASKSRYVVLLNPDTIVTPSWLDKLVNEAEKSPMIGVVAPKLLRPGSPRVLDSTGHVFQYQTGIARDRGNGELDLGQYDRKTELISCSFACGLIKREVFEDIGMLDSHLFTVCEDLDFGMRARLAGWRVVYRPDSIVYHARGTGTKEVVKDRINFSTSAYELHIMLKVYQPRSALRFGGTKFLTYPLRIAAGIRNRDPAYVKGNVRSAIWTLAHIPLRERLYYRRRRRIPDDMQVMANTRS
jgi:GT2 family glycosyltransferase